MAETINFDLVSPERLLLSEDVREVVIPGAEGDFAVLPLHAPMLSTLRPGVIEVKMANGSARRYFVHSGLADVTSDGLTILAQRAIDVDEIDRDWIAHEIAEAEQVRDRASSSDAERTLANHAIERLTELKAVI